MKSRSYFSALLLMIAACGNPESGADAYGNFEAREVIVSAEANGRLLSFAVTEGQTLAAGAVAGCIDTTQLYLRKRQLEASILAVLNRRQDVSTQASIFDEQIANLNREKLRVEKLLADGAATPKQRDDIAGQLEVVERQKIAQLTALNNANRAVRSEIDPLRAQIEQIDDQIRKSILVNPLAGRVLATYAEPQEITAFGRPLYKIADTGEMFLRVYVAGSQLPSLALGNEVEVRVDQDANSTRSLPGKVVWIAEEAEFTPKIIQTRETRVNLVYAVKVRVENAGGSLKIGMPGEIRILSGQAAVASNTAP